MQCYFREIPHKCNKIALFDCQKNGYPPRELTYPPDFRHI